MNETQTPTPPAPAAGSELMCTVTLTLSEHVLLVRTIRERAYSLRQFAASTRNESLATQALDEADRLESRAYELVNTNWTKVKRLLAVAEQAMQSIRDYPCGHKPSGVGGHCNACEALRQWDDLANTERRRPMNETTIPESTQIRWVAVADAYAIDEMAAKLACKRCGLDPYERIPVDLALPNPNQIGGSR
jgi:hypothetical protein